MEAGYFLIWSSRISRRTPERRAKLNALKAQERAKAEAGLPAPKELLLRLFEHLDEQLSSEPCDRSLKMTLSWAKGAGVDGEKLIEWTREYGGYCDCEVAGNVRDSDPAFRGW